MLRYTIDRARPGLVALYDIRPGNGAGQFLQPRSPNGANLDVSWGTGVRGLMRGMATLSQGNQELLVL